MHDTPKTTPDERPAHACLLCPPPKNRAWWPADPGYRTCSDCYDKIREQLREIGVRYLALDASPGASGEPSGRGAPGFGSRPAASPHVITMTDWRSKSCEVAFDGVQYVWDPNADTVLEPGQYGPPGGAYVERREVWFGRDGRGHTEQENPPRSIPLALSGIAAMIAEERGMNSPTTRQVPDLVRWIDAQMDWITRNDIVGDIRDELRSLAMQLRPVTGEPGRRHIGTCPRVIDEGEHTRECGTRLYAPVSGDTIRCGNAEVCEGEWPRDEWLRLGSLLKDAS